MNTQVRACLIASTMFCTIPAFPALASAGDIALDNVSLATGPQTKITIKHIDIADTNLTQDEAAKLFSGAATTDEAAALLGKFKAARITIPEATATSDKPGSFILRDLKAEGIDQGLVKRFSVAAVEGSVPADVGGMVTLKSQPLTIDNLQIQNLESAIKTGKMSGGAVKLTRLAWNGFEMTVPDKDTPADAAGGNLIAVRLDSASVDQTYDGDAPLKSATALNGLTVQLPKASKGGAMLAAVGFDKIETSLRASSSYDPAKQSFALDDFAIDAVKIGSVGMRGEFGGVAKAALTGDADAKMAAIMNADLRSLDLRVVNAGAFEKAVAFAALSQGKTPDAIKADWSAIVAQGPALLPGAPAAVQLSAALVKFIGNPKSVSVSVKPKAPPLKLADLQQTDDPIAVLAKIELTAAAEGPAAAPAAAGAPAPVATLAPATTPAPAPAPGSDPAAPTKLKGLAAWNALVGNTVTGKDSDGAPLSEYYLANGKVKQVDGDEVSVGDWIVKGEQVCFQYKGEDEPTCYKVEVFGDVATFFDDDGSGTRYAILKGNAKGL